MRRKSTGKRLRFEVFKRDHFTCQYCGAQPPDVVLVADHITPVAAGGETSIENLLTACEWCNQGKSDRPLEQRAVRPDADLLYLETQQEAAELRRYHEAKAERDDLIAKIIASLRSDFARISGFDWGPSDRVLAQLLAKYSPEIVERAVADVAEKCGGGYLQTAGGRWVGYLFAVAKNMAKEYEYELEA